MCFLVTLIVISFIVDLRFVFFFFMRQVPTSSTCTDTLFPYKTLFRTLQGEGWVGMGLTLGVRVIWVDRGVVWHSGGGRETHPHPGPPLEGEGESHGNRSYEGNVRNSCSSSACVSRSSTPIASLNRLPPGSQIGRANV